MEMSELRTERVLLPILVLSAIYFFPSVRKFFGITANYGGLVEELNKGLVEESVQKNEEEALRMDHSLFSSNVKGPSLEKVLPGLVPSPDCKISLCYKKLKIPFEHKSYSVKIETEAGQEWVIRFSQNDEAEKEGNLEGRIIIENFANNREVKTEITTELTDEMVERIDNILPATNFSHCLRNSEHLSRYIFEGQWVSMQMQNEQDMRAFFGQIFEPQHSHNIATIPEDLREKQKPVDPVTLFNDFEMATYEDKKIVKDDLKLSKNAYNIVVVGPTGAGKSTITNILFNKSVCQTGAVSKASVTRNFELVHGKYRCEDGETIDINVIDTMGFCDQFVDDEEAIKNMSSKVFDCIDIDKVVIVVSKTPIDSSHKAAIKNLLSNLEYENFKDNFLFLYNKTEDLAKTTKIDLVKQMGEDFEVDVNYKIEVKKPDASGVSRNDSYVYAGEAVGVDPNDYTAEASKDTVRWMKEAVLPHCLDVLRAPKRIRRLATLLSEETELQTDFRDGILRRILSDGFLGMSQSELESVKMGPAQ